MRTGVIAGTLIAFAACTDVSGLSGGATATGADASTDAPVGVTEAGPPDAEPDAPIDAGSDAGAACANVIVDSFDQGALGAKWDGLAQTEATLSLDTTDVSSPPNSLLVTVPANGASVHANLFRTFAAAKTVCCELSMKADFDSALFFEIVGQSDNYSLGLGSGSGNNVVRESYYVGGGDPGIDRVVGTVPKAYTTWRRMHFELAFPPGNGRGTLKVLVDGQPAIQDTLGGDNYDISVGRVQVGVTYADPAAFARSARFDDFRCGAQ